MMLPFLPLIEHRLDARLGHQEHAGKIHVQRRVPKIERIILERAVRRLPRSLPQARTSGRAPRS